MYLMGREGSITFSLLIRQRKRDEMGKVSSPSTIDNCSLEKNSSELAQQQLEINKQLASCV
jgi:hypothetical protein